MNWRRGRSGRPLARAKARLRREGANVCWRCGGGIDLDLPPNHPMAWTLDHKVPLSRGGDALDPANHAEAHRRCNSAAGNRVTAPPQPTSRRW
ncbi:HNH endonuclease [Streptomyces calidiresistens]|uniref:HNH endonuclease n=1 Tax=Streptomyces calidiresistens TaxID=1485586 RepID=A0A7W3XZF0_9ACTN|nr:HNH endonuclease [Streptomyces calidiresistens]